MQNHESAGTVSGPWRAEGVEANPEVETPFGRLCQESTQEMMRQGHGTGDEVEELDMRRA